MLVGDTQRIWVYADAGYAEPQAISTDAMDAYRRLVDAGYTRRLIDRASTSVNGNRTGFTGHACEAFRPDRPSAVRSGPHR